MSVEITIPGGTAVMLTTKELTPRRRRPIQMLDVMRGPIFAKIREARRVIHPDGTVEETEGLYGPDLVLTEQDAAMLTSYQDVQIFARLQSWTLPEPLPVSADALLDIPGDVYDALADGVVKAEAADGANPFVASEETLENPASPTGASAA